LCLDRVNNFLSARGRTTFRIAFFMQPVSVIDAVRPVGFQRQTSAVIKFIFPDVYIRLEKLEAPNEERAAALLPSANSERPINSAP
jgi:hypothetical protein